MIVALCDRFKCLPSALLAESTDLLYMINLTTHGIEVNADA